jgi:hypothetical protein
MVEVFLYPIYLLHYYFVFSEHNYVLHFADFQLL